MEQKVAKIIKSKIVKGGGVISSLKTSSTDEESRQDSLMQTKVISPVQKRSVSRDIELPKTSDHRLRERSVGILQTGGDSKSPKNSIFQGRNNMQNLVIHKKSTAIP
jgi:hypothetical protein